MSEKTQRAKSAAESGANDKKKLAELVEALSSGSRRERQNAAQVLAAMGKEQPEKLTPYGADLIDALNRPEAQTRWECLDIMTELVVLDASVCEKAIPGAETALFDEESGPVRLSAMRFLCRFGATAEDRSEQVWSLIDEGIQCYHGDLEFPDMLVAVVDFSSGTLSPRVRNELATRMSFDAANGKGALKRRAAQILQNVSR